MSRNAATALTLVSLTKSCRNRHCPKCQNKERARWLESRKAELLPAEYFHVVFTLPEEIARIAFHNQELLFGILFRAASQTLLTIAADPKHLGAEIGFFAILHTWSQNLLHHPHVHLRRSRRRSEPRPGPLESPAAPVSAAQPSRSPQHPPAAF